MDKFGSGVIIPLVKDRAADLNDMDNYRGITLVPIISKVFECFMLSVCRDVLRTDPLQFGFTSGVGCSEAIFALKSTVNRVFCALLVLLFYIASFWCLFAE